MFKKTLIFLAALLVFALAIFFYLSDPLQKKSRAGLQIEYVSGSAAVFLNDDFLGKAPLVEHQLKSGEYMLKIDPDEEGLSNFTVPIFLEKGTLTIVVYNPGNNPKNSSSTIFELRKRKDGQTAVSFETYPENALVSFDQQEANFSPLTIEGVTSGAHHFLVNLPSYEAQDHSFQVLAGYETKITVNLAKNLHLITPTPTVDQQTSQTIQSKLENTELTKQTDVASNGAVASDSAQSDQNVIE